MHIVILAYGLSQLTKRASNRARKLAGATKTVTIVPASATGLAIESPDGAPPIGVAGIRTALDKLPNDRP